MWRVRKAIDKQAGHVGPSCDVEGPPHHARPKCVISDQRPIRAIALHSVVPEPR